MSGIVFDRKKMFEEMGNTLVETVYKISLNAQAKVDKDCGGAITNLLYIFTKTFVILNTILNYTDQAKVSDKEFDSNILLWQGQNTLISSLQLTRQGYFVEPQFLIRSAVENLALSLSFFTGSDYYEKFKKNQLSGEKCIGEAKKLVKQIGGIYGLLSQVTHPSNKILGHHYLEGRSTLLIGGGVTETNMSMVKFNLAILNWVATIYWSSAELIFHNHFDNYTFWTKSGDNMKWTPNKPEEAVYTKSINLFKEAINTMPNLNQEDYV